MRFFAEIAYHGLHYSGWQLQPNGIAVQQKVEVALSTLLRAEIPVVGCGRTDAGVHATQYFLHFDVESAIPEGFLRRINQFLPKDIVVKNIFPVEPTAHARFDATRRSYEYHITATKNPFLTDTAFYLPLAHQIDKDLLQAAANSLLLYKAFFPFCKSNSDAQTMLCDLSVCEWQFQNDATQWVFHVSSNRFLRGMVRLIVGMCLNVGFGKLSLDEVKKAMEQQRLLGKSYSVPAHGLYLTQIMYPFSTNPTKKIDTGNNLGNLIV